MVRQGRVLQSWKDYILVSDRRIIQNMAVRDPRHNSDHLMVIGCLCGASPREHSCYLRRRTRLPLQPPGRKTKTRADKIFAELRHAIPKPDKQATRNNLRISAEMWRLIDKRVSAIQEPGQDHRILRRMGRFVQAELKEDRRRRVTTAGEDVKRLLSRDPPSPENHGGG